MLWTTNCDLSKVHHELMVKGNMKQGTSGGKLGVITSHDVWYTFQSPRETCFQPLYTCKHKLQSAESSTACQKMSSQGRVLFLHICECNYIKLQSCQVSTTSQLPENTWQVTWLYEIYQRTINKTKWNLKFQKSSRQRRGILWREIGSAQIHMGLPTNKAGGDIKWQGEEATTDLSQPECIVDLNLIDVYS